VTAEHARVRGDAADGQTSSGRSVAGSVPEPSLITADPGVLASRIFRDQEDATARGPAAAGAGGGAVVAPSAVLAPDLEACWVRAVEILAGAREICLACHIRPDGDALGSMLAMAHALRSRAGATGQRIIASFGDQPFEVPRILRFLPGADLLSPPESYPQRPQVMVTFDAASTDRLGLLEGCATRAEQLLVLDHHASNTRFGTLHLVDPSAAATAVLAHELIGRMGIRIDRDIASGLYAGIVTDTGSFKYASTSPRVHEIAAQLLATGIEPGAVSLELWDKAPFGYLGLLSRALGRAVLEPDAAAGHGLVWTTVSRADRAAHGLQLDVAESVIDMLRRTEEADVAVVFKEDDDGRWLVSSRSKGKVDVGRACTLAGGGGHRAAAGFTAAGTVADAMAGLRELLADGADSRR
jgi:bifunctional oligoribonuclease and PAP phosphatase NrnA